MIPPGTYEFSRESGIHSSLQRLTVGADGSFEYLHNESHGGPNTSETYRGNVVVTDGGTFLAVRAKASFSYSPVDEEPEEKTEPMEATWPVLPRPDQTIVLQDVILQRV